VGSGKGNVTGKLPQVGLKVEERRKEMEIGKLGIHRKNIKSEWRRDRNLGVKYKVKGKEEQKKKKQRKELHIKKKGG